MHTHAFKVLLGRGFLYLALGCLEASCWRVGEVGPIDLKEQSVSPVSVKKSSLLPSLPASEGACENPSAAFWPREKEASAAPKSLARPEKRPPISPARERLASALRQASGCPEPTRIWAERCQLCHGRHGNGRGVAAENLRPGPPSFVAPAWQKSISDAEIRRVIVLGSAGMGKSMMMPPEPDLDACPDVLDVLVRAVRSFSK